MQLRKGETEALVKEVKATSRKLQVGERISPECQDRYVQPGRQPAQRREWDPESVYIWKEEERAKLHKKIHVGLL